MKTNMPSAPVCVHFTRVVQRTHYRYFQKTLSFHSTARRVVGVLRKVIEREAELYNEDLRDAFISASIVFLKSGRLHC